VIPSQRLNPSAEQGHNVMTKVKYDGDQRAHVNRYIEGKPLVGPT
jgi:hypothetical protein